MKSNILIVDDDKLTLHRIKTLLEDEDHIVFSSYNGKDALRIVSENDIDVILLDIILPDITGLELLCFMQGSERTKNIPIIMITGLTSSSDVKKALDAGALDYVRKPFENIELIARVHSALRLKFKQDLLNELAQKDPLTQLYNSRYFHLALTEFMKKKADYANGIALVMLDCDHFKKINEIYSHMTGDDVLVGVANVLNKSIKRTDIPCRYGGEEFCLIMPDTTLFQTYNVAERIRTDISKLAFTYEDQSFNVTVSLGVSHLPADANRSELSLLNEAGLALYSAKRNGRNRAEIYKEE